jgi:hypothetical protein
MDNRSDIFKMNMKKNAIDQVSVDGNSLRFLSVEYKNDEDIVLAAIKENCKSLKYASNELQNDEDFIMKAIEINENSVKYASEELLDDEYFLYNITHMYNFDEDDHVYGLEDIFYYVSNRIQQELKKDSYYLYNFPSRLPKPAKR